MRTTRLWRERYRQGKAPSSLGEVVGDGTQSPCDTGCARDNWLPRWTALRKTVCQPREGGNEEMSDVLLTWLETGRPGLVTFNNCCCTHSPCAKHGHASDWCRHWFLVSWETTTPLLSTTVLDRFHTGLGAWHLRLWGSQQSGNGQCEYIVLLYVDPTGEGIDRSQLQCSLSSTTWLLEQCDVWHLPCCLQVVQREAQRWVSTITGVDPGLVFGDGSLPSHLMREVASYLKLGGCLPTVACP